MIVTRNRLWIGILLVSLGLFGLSIGIVLRNSLSSKRSLVLEPTKVVLTEDPLEGEFVEIPLVLRNYSNRRVSVIRWVESCGCIDATVRGGRPLLANTSLPSDGVMPWKMVVDTRGYVGTRRLRFGVECLDNGKHILVTSELEMTVRPGMLIEPRQLFFSDVEAGHPVKGEFMVLDALPDPGTEILKCVSSAPSRLSVSLKRVDDHANVTYGGSNSVKVRYRGVVSYRPPERRRLVHDWISIVPKRDDSSTSGTAIAVVCSTRQPSYELVPRSLVLDSSIRARKCRRELRCFLRDDAKQPLRVYSKPDWLEVSIRELHSGTVAIGITASMGAGQGQRSVSDVVFSAGTENKPVLTLPVKLAPLANIIER